MASSSRRTSSVAVTVVSTQFALPLTCHQLSRGAGPTAFPAFEPLCRARARQFAVIVCIMAGAITDTVRYTPAARCSADRAMSVPNDFPSDKGFRKGAPAAEGSMTGIRTFGSVE